MLASALLITRVEGRYVGWAWVGWAWVGGGLDMATRRGRQPRGNTMANAAFMGRRTEIGGGGGQRRGCGPVAVSACASAGETWPSPSARLQRPGAADAQAGQLHAHAPPALPGSHGAGSTTPPRCNDEVLARYIGSLRAFEPFTADEEILAARRLESVEVEVWRRVLRIPGIHALLWQAARHVDPELRVKVSELLHAGGGIRARVAEAAPTASLRAAVASASSIDQLANDLRWVDCDKTLLDAVVVLLDASAREAQCLPPHGGEALLGIRQARSRAVRVRNDFVRANLRLVIRVAQSFRAYGVPLVDAIQEGNLGLMKAVDRFDHRRGFRFSTYAHWWIRHCIQRAIANMDGQLRLPVHLREWRRRIEESRRQLRHGLGRDPSFDEIANELGTTAALLEERLAAAHRVCYSFDDDAVEGAETRASQEVALEAAARGVDDVVIEQDLRMRLRDFLGDLKPIEREIIARRYGLGDDQDQTLEEVSRVYNLSRERVRQIQQQGIAKLRRICKVHRVSG